MRQTDAMAAIRSAGLAVTLNRANVNAERGTIVQQSPDPGAPLRPGATVTLAVATGQVEIPDVADLREQEALRRLYDAGFKVPTIRGSASKSVPAGFVIRTDPAAGKVLERGAEVDLYVSTGPRD